MKMNYLAMSFLCLAMNSAFAASESNFKQQMAEQVTPFYQTGIDGEFSGVNNITIRYKKWEAPSEKGAIVVVPGRADAFATFAETIYDLSRLGYSIYTLDHRGQGSSGRILTNSQADYVDHFDDFITDFAQFMKTVVAKTHHEKTFIVAHSMGGAISTLYAAENPSAITGLVLASPMFEINTAPYARWEAQAIIESENLIGNGKEYARGKKDFNPAAPFEGNNLTQSEVRWDFLRSTLITQNLFVGGPTNKWVQESFSAGKKIQDLSATFIVPTLLVTSGNDKVVDSSAASTFCKAAKNCLEIPTYAGASHDILSEKDSVRVPVFKNIADFLAGK